MAPKLRIATAFTRADGRRSSTATEDDTTAYRSRLCSTPVTPCLGRSPWGLRRRARMSNTRFGDLQGLHRREWHDWRPCRHRLRRLRGRRAPVQGEPPRGERDQPPSRAPRGRVRARLDPRTAGRRARQRQRVRRQRLHRVPPEVARARVAHKRRRLRRQPHPSGSSSSSPSSVTAASASKGRRGTTAPRATSTPTGWPVRRGGRRRSSTGSTSCRRRSPERSPDLGHGGWAPLDGLT